MGLLKSAREAELEVIERVKSLRVQQRWTQEELAERAGIPFSTYRRFEQSGKISLERLLMVAMVLGDPGKLVELFPLHEYQSLEEIERAEERQTTRYRASRKGAP